MPKKKAVNNKSLTDLLINRAEQLLTEASSQVLLAAFSISVNMPKKGLDIKKIKTQIHVLSELLNQIEEDLKETKKEKT